jgi:hypothetical protein
MIWNEEKRLFKTYLVWAIAIIAIFGMGVGVTVTFGIMQERKFLRANALELLSIHYWIEEQEKKTPFSGLSRLSEIRSDLVATQVTMSIDGAPFRSQLALTDLRGCAQKGTLYIDTNRVIVLAVPNQQARKLSIP